MNIGPRIHFTVLLFLLLLCPAVASGAFFSVESIEPGFEKDPPYGEIVREIRVEGNRYTRESMILNAMKSQVGHPYSEDNAHKDMTWIAQMGAFSAVRFHTEPHPDGISLVVTVTEASPYLPSISFKLTQENGIEIGPSISSMNLFGTAARAGAYARFGGATNIGIRYADPQLPRGSLIWGYKLSYFHRERTNQLLDFQETSDEVFFEFGQGAGENMRSGIRARYIGLGSETPGITLDPDNHDDVPSLGFFVHQDSRNSIYPTDGWYMDLELSKWGLFGGNGDWWRVDLDVRRYLPAPILGDRHSFAFSTYGMLMSGEMGETIPLWQESFVGGTNSVRGWSLGAREGQNQWLTTGEYWFRLMDQKKWKFWFIRWPMGFQIGLYGDFGSAWTAYEDLERNMIAGFGAGFRLTMPVITMVRLDAGYGEDGFGVRFFVGGAEKADAQKYRVR